jgi:hypothetical protein
MKKLLRPEEFFYRLGRREKKPTGFDGERADPPSFPPVTEKPTPSGADTAGRAGHPRLIRSARSIISAVEGMSLIAWP